MRRIAVATEEWRLARPFVIARDTRTSVEVVRVTVRGDNLVGRGECRPYARYGEMVDGVVGQIGDAAPLIKAGGDRQALLAELPAGAARNALDCALWDLEAKQAGVRAWDLAGLPPPTRAVTAATVAIGPPDAMAAAARAWDAAPLLKIKLDGEAIVERVAAVRRAAPAASLIVDANEAWDFATLTRVAAPLADLGVELIEQPLPAGDDAELWDWRSPIPLCADESFHGAADVERLAGGYAWVNVKLDKAGGLTAAIDAVRAAEARGLRILVGCMVGTSLAIAPALCLAGLAPMLDLDGPLWLAPDRRLGLAFERGMVSPPDARLWG